MLPSWEDMGFGPYSVTEIAHSTITMPDGIDLAVKYWLPALHGQTDSPFESMFDTETEQWSTEIYRSPVEIDSTNDRFPTILECLPYYKDGFTSVRDHARHPWFASHGFVSARVEIRGTGASEGFYYDEYSEREMADCTQVIDWLSTQQWSNGRVGMYGKSWGGFNGLQMAYRQPTALKTAISLYSTDNRYTDDIHYEGDCVIGNGMLNWAANMSWRNARPPPPRYFTSRADWLDAWRLRLDESSQSPLLTWLSHQHADDPYWKHGSVSEDIERVSCPILVIGGHVDAYTNSAFRMAATLNSESRAIIGPWPHNWPDSCCPGPNIDFLQVCREWFSFHLKLPASSQAASSEVNVMEWPRLRVFLRESFDAAQACSVMSGQFVNVPMWNDLYADYQKLKDGSSSIANFKASERIKCLYLGPDKNISIEQISTNIPTIELMPHALQGANSGNWCAFGENMLELPGNQSVADKHSTCWYSPPLEEDVIFAGFSTMFVAVETRKRGRFCVQVRVCDVDGKDVSQSTLVTRGMQNIARLDNTDGWEDEGMNPGEVCLVPIQLKAVGHIIKAGRRICISISPTYFPWMWPAVDSVGLVVHSARSFLVRQTLTVNDLLDTFQFPPPKPLLQIECEQLCEPSLTSEQIVKEPGTYRLRNHEDEGRVRLPTLGCEYQVLTEEDYATDEQVSSGEVFTKKTLHLNFFDLAHSDTSLAQSDSVATRVEFSHNMSGDRDRFKISERVEVFIDDTLFFERSWDNVVPRKYV